MKFLKSKSAIAIVIGAVATASFLGILPPEALAAPAVTTITVTPATGTYGGALSLSATLTSGGSGVVGKAIAFTLNGIAAGTATTNGSGLASLTNASLSGVNAGTYATGITASFAGDAGYAATSGNASLTVDRAVLNILNLAANSRAYDGTTTATLNTSGVTLEGRIAGDSVGLTGTAVFDNKDVGSGKTVSVTGLALTGAAAGNYTLSSTTATLTASITPRPLTITADAKSKVYRAAEPELTYTITSGSLVGSDTLTGSLTRAAGENAGSYAIQRGTLIAGSNYDINFATANLTITPAPLTVEGITAASKEYDGTITATIDATGARLAGLLEGDAVTLNSSAATGSFANKNVGAGKTVTVSGLTLGGTSAANYTITPPTTTASITRRALEVTADAKSKVYGAALPTLTAHATGLGSGDTLTSLNLGYTLGTTATTTSPPGSYPITFAGGASLTTNYGPITYNASTLTVTRATLTVTGLTVTSKVYDGTTAATLSGTAHLSGVIGSDVVTLAGTAVGTYTDKNVGSSKTVTVSGLTLAGAAADSYSLTQPTLSGAITAKPITVSADAKTKSYGASDPPLTYTLTAGSLCGSDAMSGALTRAAGESIGTRAIQQGTLTAGSNYTITYVGQSLTITKAATLLTLDSSANPSAFGQSVTFSATVASNSGTPTGTVQFAIDGNNFGTGVSLSSGVATSAATSTLSIGTHTITASYNGDASFATCTADLEGGQTVAQAGAIANYLVATIRSPQTAGVPFTVVIQARDAFGNNVTTGPSASEYVTIKYGVVDSGASPEGVTTSGGTASIPVTMSVATKTQTLTFTGSVSGVSGASSGFTVSPGSPSSATQTPTPTPTPTNSRPSPTPTLTPVVKDVSSSLNAKGYIAQPVIVPSADSRARLSIAADTLARTADGKPIAQVSVAPMPNPPPAPQSCYIIGAVYDFGPEGTTFSPPASLSLTYDPKLIPASFNENDVRVVTYDKILSQWAFMTSTVDTSVHASAARVDHFSAFTLMTTKLSLPPLTVAGLQVTPSQIAVGEKVTISATVSNPGDLAGVYNVTLQVNGTTSDTRSVTVAGKRSEKVTFTITGETAGDYSFDLNGLAGKFTVLKASSTPAATPKAATSTTPAPPKTTPTAAATVTKTASSGVNWWLMLAIVLLVVIVVVVLLTVVRRRAHSPAPGN